MSNNVLSLVTDNNHTKKGIFIENECKLRQRECAIEKIAAMTVHNFLTKELALSLDEC